MPTIIESLQRTAPDRSVTGYGAKLPTPYIVRFKGRERRVYCTNYSNIGTCWIVVGGKRWIVEDTYKRSASGQRMLEVTDRQFGRAAH